MIFVYFVKSRTVVRLYILRSYIRTLTYIIGHFSHLYIFRLSSSLPKHSLAYLLSNQSNSSTSSSISVSKKSKLSANCTAQVFSFVNKGGDTIYGMLYRPADYDPDKRYPTICYVYGGPSVQVQKIEIFR